MANAIKYSCLLGINYPHTIASLISISLLCHKYCMSFLLSLSLTHTDTRTEFFSLSLFILILCLLRSKHTFTFFSVKAIALTSAVILLQSC